MLKSVPLTLLLNVFDPAPVRSLSTRGLMMPAAVGQPLAANPRHVAPRPTSSLTWKGCGSTSAARVLIRPL
jgi:hypothetical protein